MSTEKNTNDEHLFAREISTKKNQGAKKQYKKWRTPNWCTGIFKTFNSILRILKANNVPVIMKKEKVKI